MLSSPERSGPSSLPRPESVSCSLSFACTVALTRVCAKLCGPKIWDTSPESTLIGQQDFGVEDQGISDVPSHHVGGAAGYETKNNSARYVGGAKGEEKRSGTPAQISSHRTGANQIAVFA